MIKKKKMFNNINGGENTDTSHTHTKKKILFHLYKYRFKSMLIMVSNDSMAVQNNVFEYDDNFVVLNHSIVVVLHHHRDRC